MFFLYVGKRGSQAARATCREGRGVREWGGAGGSCSTTPGPLLPLFSTPLLSPLTLPSGRYLSLSSLECRRSLSPLQHYKASLRHSVDPTLHIPTVEGEVEVQGEKQRVRGGGAELDIKHVFNSQLDCFTLWPKVWAVTKPPSLFGLFPRAIEE